MSLQRIRLKYREYADEEEAQGRPRPKWTEPTRITLGALVGTYHVGEDPLAVSDFGDWPLWTWMRNGPYVRVPVNPW